MTRNRWMPLVALLAAGCGGPTVPTAKFFSGQPTAHWVQEMKSRDAKVRKHAADVLGNVGTADPDAIPALAAAVKDPDPRVRDAAVLGLSKIGPPAAAALPVLEEATKDGDPVVRQHAAAAVGRVRGG